MDFNEFIDDIATKFGYDEELVSALKRCIPVMAEGKDQESLQLLKDTLERVEIIVFENLPTREELDQLMNKKKNGRNDHVTFKGKDRGEYNKAIASSAYSNDPIFDDNMNIIDRVGFIYTTKLKEYEKSHETYGSMINLSHLIHEIGHAWAAQKDEFTQREDGNYVNRVGTAEILCEVDRENHTVEEKEVKGLYIEEATNTLEEERAICKLLNVHSINEIPGYEQSPYQWKLVDLMYMLNDELELDMLEKMRFQNDKSIKQELDEYFKKTGHFEGRKADEYIEQKENTFKSYRQEENMPEDKKARLNSFFEKYDSVFFGRKDVTDFMEYFDGILESFYNLREYKYNFFDEETLSIFPSYNNIINAMQREGIDLIKEMGKVHLLEKENDLVSSKEAMINALKGGVDIETIEKVENVIGMEQEKDIETKEIEGDQ